MRCWPRSTWPPAPTRASTRDLGIRSELAGEPVGEAAARGLCGRLARALQASLLVRHSSDAVADAFCAARLGEGAGGAFGDASRPAPISTAILERARPGSPADARRGPGAMVAIQPRVEIAGGRQEPPPPGGPDPPGRRGARARRDLAAGGHDLAQRLRPAYAKVARPLVGEPLALLRNMAREYGCLVGGGFIAVRGQDTRGTYALCRARRRHPPARQGSAVLLGEQLLLARHRRRRDGHVAGRHRLRQRLRVGPHAHGRTG